MKETEAPLGDRLLELCESATTELTLCAPFVKHRVMERLLSATPHGARVRLYTRWRPEEIAAGVSDTSVFDLVAAREGSLFLHNNLHAKFYRTQTETYIGSANLTARALGWCPHPNVEILVRSSADDVLPVEARLEAESIAATQSMAEAAEEAAALFPRGTEPDVAPEEGIEVGGPELWFPSLRHPADLFVAYVHGDDRLTAASADAARSDMAALDIPLALERAQFYAVVGQRLQTDPFVQQLNHFLSRPRRFGEVRDHLYSVRGLDRHEAELEWQTLMRWLLEFLPEHYEHTVARRTEMFVRTDRRYQ